MANEPLKKAEQTAIDKLVGYQSRPTPNVHKDRVRVIVSVAEIDNLLLELLSTYLIATTEDRDTLLAEGGVIGTLVLRAKLCYRLGLISSQMYAHIKKLSEIRNDCAHSKEESIEVFKMDKIISFVDHTWRLIDPRYKKGVKEDDIPDKFTTVCWMISIELELMLKDIKPIKQPKTEGFYI